MALVSPVEAPVRISDAIRKASETSGTDFDYLLATAARESNFRPAAKAKTSSATGLFQFIESTWLQTVKQEGARFGLGKYNPHMFRTSKGHYYVPNRKVRAAILQLRENPEVAAVMAVVYTRKNAEYVGSRLGRQPTQGKLFIAHFLGPGGATKLITLASKDPNARADSHFPHAASANKGIFYASGQPRSVSQVYDLLVADHSKFETLTVAADQAKAGGTSAQTADADGQPHETAIAESSAIDLAADAKSPLTPDSLAAPAAFQSSILRGEEAGPLVDQGSIAPEPKIRVAALDRSAISLQGQQTMSDAGLGSIGAWHTIVERADGTVIDDAASDPAPEGEVPPADGKDERAAAVPIRTRLHGGEAAKPKAAEPVARRASSRAIKVTLPPVKDFASEYWISQALYGA